MRLDEIEENINIAEGDYRTVKDKLNYVNLRTNRKISFFSRTGQNDLSAGELEYHRNY